MNQYFFGSRGHWEYLPATQHIISVVWEFSGLPTGLPTSPAGINGILWINGQKHNIRKAIMLPTIPRHSPPSCRKISCGIIGDGSTTWIELNCPVDADENMASLQFFLNVFWRSQTRFWTTKLLLFCSVCKFPDCELQTRTKNVCCMFIWATVSAGAAKTNLATSWKQVSWNALPNHRIFQDDFQSVQHPSSLIGAGQTIQTVDVALRKIHLRSAKWSSCFLPMKFNEIVAMTVICWSVPKLIHKCAEQPQSTNPIESDVP